LHTHQAGNRFTAYSEEEEDATLAPVKGIFGPGNPPIPLKDAVALFPFDYKTHLWLAEKHVKKVIMKQRIASVPGMTEVRERCFLIS